MDAAGGDGSSGSLELDILALSQRWEAQRTIRNGDTPGAALRRKGDTPCRPALAPLAVNTLPSQQPAVNPFSLTAQRHKAVGGRPCQAQQHEQQQQQTVRFALDSDGAENRVDAAAAAAPSAAATPAAAPPVSTSRGCVATGGASAGASPSPYVLFRGRLSFAAEVDSVVRKFDARPPTSGRKAEGGAGLKRKLAISPGADISAAFPSLRKPAAKQRRRSFGTADAALLVHESADAAADAVADAAAAAAGEGAAFYWSDPLPLPGSACLDELPAAAAAAAAAGDDDMQDTAASPTSSSGGGGICDSPALARGMEACCCSSPPPPAFSPLLGGAEAHALPTVDHPDCGFPAITPQTLRDLLVHGPAAFGLDGLAVVDCRYDYEFAGGHLPGAVHLPTPEALLGWLAATPEEAWARTAVVFHCEFSTERGPRAAKYVRSKDREAHLHDYPALSHPHVFVLQGGYKAFWRAHPELCEGGYTPMDHPDHSDALKACHNAVKKAWARTTRTHSRQQRKRRPSYRLRQSTGAPSASRDASAAAEEGEGGVMQPALVAACHMLR